MRMSESRQLDRRIVRFPASEASPDVLCQKRIDLLGKPGAFPILPQIHPTLSNFLSLFTLQTSNVAA